jgi:hypothetical protein
MTALERLLAIAIVLAPLAVLICTAAFGSAEDVDWPSDEEGWS